MIWKIWMNDKLKCEKILKIWKKSKLKSEKILKIQKKSKLFPNLFTIQSTFLVHDFIKHFIFPVLFPALFQTPTFKISVTCLSSTWWKKSKLNSEKIWKKWRKGKLNSEMIWKLWKKCKLNFPVLFQSATFKISVSCFSSTWRYKTIYFPVLFPHTFSNSMFELQRYLLRRKVSWIVKRFGKYGTKVSWMVKW
jgi:hypothetical protein